MPEKANSTEQKTNFAHPDNNKENTDKREQYLNELQDSLAVRLRAGDRAAAGEFVDMYHERIYLYMRRLGHNRQTSEDLTQESFFQAWQHIGQLKNGRALNRWLYRIASNVSKLHWRRHKCGESVSIEEIGIEIPENQKAAFDSIEHYEQIGRLKNAVTRLPIKLRQAIVLHYMQHLTIAEAAEAAGVRQGTFKSRLNRALETLRKQVI